MRQWLAVLWGDPVKIPRLHNRSTHGFWSHGANGAWMRARFFANGDGWDWSRRWESSIHLLSGIYTLTLSRIGRQLCQAVTVPLLDSRSLWCSRVHEEGTPLYTFLAQKIYHRLRSLSKLDRRINIRGRFTIFRRLCPKFVNTVRDLVDLQPLSDSKRFGNVCECLCQNKEDDQTFETMGSNVRRRRWTSISPRWTR